MPRDMLGDAATLGDGTDTGKARVIMRNGKYPAVPAQSPVFADYAVGDVEQADVGHHARFLAVDVYPLVFVEVGADILFRKVAHIRERQPREGAEQVEVAVQFLFGVFQFPSISRRISSLVRKLRVVSSFLISYSRNGSRVSHSLLMAMNTIVRNGQTYSHTVLVQQCLSVRRNISKSEMKAGVSSFRAMSFTW